MKNISILLAVCTIGIMSCSSKPSHIRSDQIIFDIKAFENLKSFDSEKHEEFSKWLILAYVPALSCQTCTNRDLAYMGEMNRNLSKKLDFALICNTTNIEYIRNIRRVARVDFPILIESEEAPLGFTPHFHFLLIDKARGQSVLQFYPSSTIPLEDGMIPFEQAILRILD